MPRSNHPTTAALVVMLILLLGQVGRASGQFPTEPERQPVLQPADTVPDGPRRLSAPPVPSLGPLLDRPVSRTEYQLGPGDRLSLGVFGFRSQVFDLVVTPEGTVVIPTVGVVRVGGSNLEQAERVVARKVRQFYQDVEVNLTLSAVRAFKVFLLGDVTEPGVREATSVTRVSELVPPITEDSVVRRNVRIRRAAGDTLHVDLARFLYLGELAENPSLLDGDIVQVPPVHETVLVSGRVAFPGRYEYLPGQTLVELLRIANGGGPFPSDAADSLILRRFTNDPAGRIETIARNELAARGADAIVLSPSDAVFIPHLAHFREQNTATVEGEVFRPGLYPILPAVTTLQDLIRMAGGFTSDASLIGALLFRRPPDFVQDADRALDRIPPEFLSEDDQRILSVTRRGNEQSVVIDLADMFEAGQDAVDLKLQDGDLLQIPQRRHEIAVLGAVTQPGLVAYDAAQTIDHFVARAGGYLNRADRNDVIVLKAGTGARMRRNDHVILEPGDRIVVPYREPKTLVERIQTVQGVIGTISSVVLTVVGLQRLF